MAKNSKTNINGAVEALSDGIVAKNVLPVAGEKFLHAKYLPYAYYVIRDRALVGRDGLKPVQKRIIYSMYKANITPGRPHVKAAKVASNVMGDFHPHGNQSIEAALARLGQTHSNRVPLIDPEGSVGYFAGDTPASARYWEACLTKPAVELVRDVDSHALPVGKNYDGTLDEYAVLPARWPSSIINGTEGIAVGYAAKLYPHNPTEVMNAIIATVKNPEITIEELLKIMPGPDFPTGGEIIGADNLINCYRDGNGSIIVRGRYKTESLSRGRTKITFYELPYQVPADKIISEITTAQRKKKGADFGEVSKVKNLSGLHGMELTITLKSGTNVDVFMEKLFKKTSASKSFSFNQTVLENGSPSQLSIQEVIEQFIDLRKLCIKNSAQYEINRLQDKIHNDKGLATVLVDLRKTLDIITESDTIEDAKQGLMKEFKIDETQAQFVLSIQLRRLTRADRDAILRGVKELEEKLHEQELILSDKEKFNEVLISQLEETKKIIADPRRTLINTMTADEMKAEEQAAKIRAKALEKGASIELITYADGSIRGVLEGSDYEKSKLPVVNRTTITTKDEMFAITKEGKAIKFPSTYLPIDNKVAHSALGLDEEYLSLGKVASDKNSGTLIVTNFGKVALVEGNSPMSAKTFDLVALDEGEEVFEAITIDSSNYDKNLTLASSSGLITRFPVSSIRGARSGVRPIKGMGLDDGQTIVGASLTDENGLVFSVTADSVKLTDLSEIAVKGRGTKGMQLHRITAKSGPLLSMIAISEGQFKASDKLGNSIALPPVTKKATSGIKFATLGLVYGTVDDIPNVGNNESEN